MTDQELFKRAVEISEKISRRRLKNVPVKSVMVERKGNFTIAILNEQFIGVAKRNPNDKDNPHIGIDLALHRAMEDSI